MIFKTRGTYASWCWSTTGFPLGMSKWNDHNSRSYIYDTPYYLSGNFIKNMGGSDFTEKDTRTSLIFR